MRGMISPSEIREEEHRAEFRDGRAWSIEDKTQKKKNKEKGKGERGKGKGEKLRCSFYTKYFATLVNEDASHMAWSIFPFFFRLRPTACCTQPACNARKKLFNNACSGSAKPAFDSSVSI